MMIKKIIINGLFGDRTVTLEPKNDCIILVGPNGIGKSTVVNIIYFFISRQWERLLTYQFSKIAICLEEGVIEAKREDVEGLVAFNSTSRSENLPTPVRKLIDRLEEFGRLEEFMSAERLSPSDRTEISNIAKFPLDEVDHVHRYINRRFTTRLGGGLKSLKLSIEKDLMAAFPGRAIYLPTYRRIEKDIKEIFPDLRESIVRSSRLSSETLSGQSGSHFIDLVSFGMADVKGAIDRKMRDMRDYSLESYNDLSGRYLKDVIGGTADTFLATQISSLTNEDLATILSRVSDAVLSKDEKRSLKEKLAAIRGKDESEVDLKDRYLAHYFSHVVDAHAKITKRESDISRFVEVCNNYLLPRKRMCYDEISFEINVIGDKENVLNIDDLSSGEKQVVSLFSHLYLEDTTAQIILIDEPELSLSVPWQKKLLTDVIASGRAGFLMAVTHSPFIYQNSLRPSAMDLRRRTTIEFTG